MYLTGFKANDMGAGAAPSASSSSSIGLALALVPAAPRWQEPVPPASWKVRDDATTTQPPHRPPAHPQRAAAGLPRPAPARRPTSSAALGGWLWLAIIIVPVYYVVVTSLKDQAGYFTENPLASPTSPTLDNYRLVLQNDFVRYFVNSVIVTVGTVVPALLVSLHGLLRDRPWQRAAARLAPTRCSCWAWPSPCRRRSSRSTA